MLMDYGAVCDPNTGEGVEIWNNARTAAYASHGIRPQSMELSGCECDTLEEMLSEGQSYETPGLGPIAPWFDPGDCDSGKFAGLLMLDIQGIDDASFDRQVIAGLNEGAAFGPLRRRHKEFTFRALLIGSDHCGVNYGLNWLKQALADMADDCDFSDLTMFECCPCIEEDCDGNRDIECAQNKYERTFKKVALLSGPTVTNRYGSTCGCGCGGCSMMEVEWTFGVGMPYKFHNPVKVVNGVTAGGLPVRCVEWFKGDGDEDCSCFGVGCSSCADGTVATPPRAPSIQSSVGCSQPVVYAEECFRIDADTLPDSGESVLIIEVENGSAEEVTGVSVTIIPNANDTPCDQLDDCDACATISVDCVPPYSTYRVDGTIRASEIIDASGSNPCSVFSGQACFPVLDPCVDHCVCVRFAGTPNRNVKITVSVVGREN